MSDTPTVETAAKSKVHGNAVTLAMFSLSMGTLFALMHDPESSSRLIQLAGTITAGVGMYYITELANKVAEFVRSK